MKGERRDEMGEEIEMKRGRREHEMGEERTLCSFFFFF
jgi:hypothetical protein